MAGSSGGAATYMDTVGATPRGRSPAYSGAGAPLGSVRGSSRGSGGSGGGGGGSSLLSEAAAVLREYNAAQHAGGGATGGSSGRPHTPDAALRALKAGYALPSRAPTPYIIPTGGRPGAGTLHGSHGDIRMVQAPVPPATPTARRPL